MLLVVHFSQEFLPEESTLLNKQPIFFFCFTKISFQHTLLIVWCQQITYMFIFSPYVLVGRGMLKWQWEGRGFNSFSYAIIVVV